jgi:hypothetical protein
MLKLSNVSIYNLKDELVLSKSSGYLNQHKDQSTFKSNLKLSGAEDNQLTIGESYYAVGIGENNMPVRSEIIQCSKTGTSPVFQGSFTFPDKPEKAKPGDLAGAASEADMLIEYTNYSSTAFNLSTWGANLQYGFGGLTNSPGPILLAHSGQQSIGASQILGVVDEGPADIYLCWAQGINFGVWIHFNFQMFGMGPRPVWYVPTNGSDWKLASNDPATPYTWDPSAVGFNIVGTPTSGHSSLTVSVVITDLKK